VPYVELKPNQRFTYFQEIKMYRRDEEIMTSEEKFYRRCKERIPLTRTVLF
jgi:hypothetical protein